MRKQSVVTIFVLVIILIFSVGYALFSNTVEITGTATATASLDVEFTSASVTTEVGSIDASASISNDHNTLSINVPKLEYPGAYVIISGTITNSGTLPVKLTSIDESNSIADGDIKVSYTNLGSYENVVLNPNGTQTFTVKVEWDADSDASGADLYFAIGLNYTQAA